MKYKIGMLLIIGTLLVCGCDSNQIKPDGEKFILSNHEDMLEEIFDELEQDIDTQYLISLADKTAAMSIKLDYNYLMGDGSDMTKYIFSNDIAVHDFSICTTSDNSGILYMKMRVDDPTDRVINYYELEPDDDTVIPQDELLKLTDYLYFVSTICSTEFLFSPNEELGDMYMQLAFEYYWLKTDGKYKKLSEIKENLATEDDYLYIIESDTMTRAEIGTLSDDDYFVYVYLAGMPSMLSGLGSELGYVEGFLIPQE